MSRRLVILGLVSMLLLLNGLPIIAQGDPEWVPENIEALLAPGVELVGMEYDSSSLEQSSARLNFLPEYELIISDTGRVYQWLPEFASLVYLRLVLNNKAYFVSDPYLGHLGDVVWILDLDTGEYTRINGYPEFVDTYCGPYRYHALVEGYSVPEWVFIPGANGAMHVCSLETGYRSGPLPVAFDNWEAHTTPLTDRAIFLTATAAGAVDSETAHFFTLETQTQVVTYQGEYTPLDELFVGGIYDETKWIIGTRDRATGEVVYYRLDTAQAASLEQLPQLPPPYGYWDNPPQLRSVLYKEFDPDDPGICDVTMLDLHTDEITSFTQYDEGCRPSDPNRRIYYRAVNADQTEATLYEMTVLGEDPVAIFTGPVEQLEWISADRRYAVLVLSVRDRIHSGPSHDTNPFDTIGGRLVLVDLEDGNRVLFETDAEISPATGALWDPTVVHFQDGWLSVEGKRGQGSDLIHFEREGVTVTHLEGGMGARITEDWLVRYPSGVSGGGYESVASVSDIALYNIETQAIVPIITLDSSGIVLGSIPGYILTPHLGHLGGDRFEVQFQYITYSYPWPLYDSVRVQIRVPGFTANE